MVLLDLSVSFDTIDHETFLERLRYRYGFSNLVLQWFTSYLIDRPQHIVLDKFSSQPRRLLCGVPQGSVLGPVLFSLKISPLAHGLNAKMYADFSQLYIIVRQRNRTSATALQELALCIQDIIFWNVCNMFIYNPKKTEIIHLTFYTAPKPVPSIKIGDCSVTPRLRLEIVQSLQVEKSRALGSHLTAISLLKLTSTLFVASPNVLFTTLEKLGTFYLDLLGNVLFMHLFFQNLIPATAFFTAYPPWS